MRIPDYFLMHKRNFSLKKRNHRNIGIRLVVELALHVLDFPSALNSFYPFGPVNTESFFFNS